MKWEYFGTTLLFMVIGYLFGSISWAVIISKFYKKEDVRTKGSKNAGATNALRVYGAKIGLIVLILDILKPVIPALLAYIAHSSGTGAWSGILVQAVPLAAVAGHIFPVFFQFKGGKGASCFVGLALTIQWYLFFFGLICFIFIVFKTKKVSIGSILASFMMVILNIIFIFIPIMNNSWGNPIAQDPELWVNAIVLFIAWILLVWRHKENIKRIIAGNERNIIK